MAPNLTTIALQGLTPEALARALPPVTLPEARKIVSAVHRHKGIALPITGVRRESMNALRAQGAIPELVIREQRSSALDPFMKLVLATPDGKLVETVRIPLEKAARFSVCVSSQVGCALACAFCATGKMGLLRNLETWEIVEQVRSIRRTLGQGDKIHGVVFQGMGEPMANLDRVLEAIFVLCDPSAQAIDARGMTVCTAGIPSGIRRLAKEAPKVRLGISIASALAPVRRSLMPIDRAHSLDEVMDAAVEHAKVTELSPMWAVTLLEGVNDTPEDARALAELARSFAERAGARPRISIIPYNATDDVGKDPFRRAGSDRETAYREAMRSAGVNTHKRYSGGGDMGAACGQLASRA